MKPYVSLFIWTLLFVAAAAPAAGQDVVNVRVFTEPSGARYVVDGQTYTAPSTFLWPKGSKHVVTVVTPNLTNPMGGTICDGAPLNDLVQFDPTCRIRYGFGGWTSNLGTLPSAGLLTQTITADAGLTTLKANFSVQYRVEVALVDGPVNGTSEFCTAKANRPVEARRTGEGVGVILLGGQCFDYSGYAWLAPGDIALQAIPFEGYAFGGWHLDGGPDASPVTMYKVRGPAVIAPRFMAAKRVHLLTDPVGLRVRVDRSEILTINPKEWTNAAPIPGRYDWLPGSRHILGGVSPQTDQALTGKMWVFHSWSNGGGQDMIYTADDNVVQVENVVAKFVPGVQVNFSTEPRGLRLNIDGRENWPTYGFVWGLGSKYQVVAPAEQVDSRGRKWTFKSWKHGGPAAQEIAIDDAAIAAGGVYYTATYEALPQLVLQSSLPGVQIKVDGVDCAAPCRIDKPAGSQVKVSAPTTLPISEVSRYQFLGWHDGAPAERVITISADSAAFQANYEKMNRLIAVLDPEEGGVIRADPASADGFYTEGATVGVTLEPKPGFKFRRWDGDLAGNVPSGVLNMSMSHAIRGYLDRVPFLPVASVRNAAAPTPVEGVAPGSLISIGGASLTTAFEAGPASPLAQTLGGVVVVVRDRILPLIYVSPDQINALLPSDFEPGIYKVEVRPQSGPQVSSEFTIVRNAPGLFLNMVESRSYAVVLREDGTPVTAENRAKRGEMITMLGTGFGAYNRPVVDGFAVPTAPQYTLIDPVELQIGANTIRPLWAGAQPGNTGVVGVRFRVPEDVAGDVEVRVTVAGAASNTVLLPVE